MKHYLVSLLLLVAFAAAAQNDPVKPPYKVAEDEATWGWSTSEVAPAPTYPVLVGYVIKEAYGARMSFGSLVLYTDLFVLPSNQVPGDKFLNEVIAVLARSGKLEKVKGLDNPERASVSILSFEFVRNGWIFSTEDLPQP